MAQPPTYNRLTSFSDLTAQSPSTPAPGNLIDAEYNAIKTTLDAILVDLALIQNDDTTVKNASIGPAQLSSQLTTGFTAPTAWLTGTAYTASPASCVLQSSKMYICLVSHTSGTFATDLAANKWLQIFDLTAISVGTASQVAVSAHGTNVVTNVQTSLNNLEDNKAAASHTHTASQISDSTSDGRAFLTASLASQKTLLGLGSLAFLNSVAVTAISANLAFTGKITPAALVANTNDWAPTGWATSAVVEVSASTPINITGFQATTDGDIKLLDNVGTNNITLTSNDVLSAAANRIALPRPMLLRPGQSTVFKYDGAIANTVWRLQSPVSTSPGGASFKNLVIGNAPVTNLANYTAPGTPTTQFVVTYDELVLEDANGETWRVANGNHTISTGTTGAVNGLESAFSLVSAKPFVWVIGNPTANTIGGLMSLSATSPTLPSGYTFKARIGSTFTNGSSILVRTIQVGRNARYVVVTASATPNLPIMISGNSGSTTIPTWTAVGVGAYVPTTASKIGVALFGQGSGGATAMVAPNNSYGAFSSTTNPPPIAVQHGNTSNDEATVASEIMLESTNIYYAAVSFANAGLACTGWEDNI